MNENLMPVENTQQLIVVRQLPIIEERLRDKKDEISAKVREAVNMVCTLDTLSAVKKLRADLNKESTEYETARKGVKRAVLAPYDKFEVTYKECISEPFSTADAVLKEKIALIEGDIKAEKEAELRAYYMEHLAAERLSAEDWPFERAGIKVTLSKTGKALKEEAAAYIAARSEDISAIESMDDADEVMAEYKRGGNLASAVQTVKVRREAAERARAQREARAAEEAQRREAQSCVQPEVIAPPVVTAAPAQADSPDEPVLCLTFKVRGTRTQLKALKNFLINGGYDYE